MVLGCDPSNNVLWEKYDILADWAIRLMTETPASIVERHDALDSRDPLVERVLRTVSRERDRGRMSEVIQQLRTLIDESRPRKVAP